MTTHKHDPEFVNPLFSLSYTICRKCGHVIAGTPPPPGYDWRYDDRLSQELWDTQELRDRSDRMHRRDA